LTSDEANELVSLSNDFPYSQVIHNLAARGAKDNALTSKDKLLTISAIYSTDRVALKSIMTAQTQPRVEIKQPSVAEQILTSSIDHLPNDQLVDQLMADFAAMHESKKAFEQFIETMESQQAEPLAPVEKKKEKEKQEPKPMALHGNDLIEEIKSTKKKIKPESTKQIEQIEIIDQFIKTQPSIPRTKAVAPPPETNDLSEPSGQFGDNIVSETLVEILLKQGKKEKAIEALKKLIWKFPQKKAYFAAQIEDLRK
jgi:tetratricopeptide (TPR) repeat protein